LARTDGGALSDASADIRGGQKIEITGSRLRRIDGDTALPVNTYSREDIARSGQPSLERFLSSLNEASMSPGEGNFGTLSGQASVQLRGLPVGSTLVLVNGRRVQAVGSSTGNIFNLNLIPLAAVERIEIVPVGSSAVYGGDALAGVVNIILKSSLDGLALDARVAAGRGFGDGSISLAGGGGDERGGFVLLGSYSKATPLNAADRAFFVDGDYRRFDGRDARTRNCTPGTVTSASGANLPGLNSSFAGIPNVASGQALTAASFSATAGLANLCGSLANGNGSALIYGDEQFGLHGSAHYQLGQGISAFGELTLAKDKLNAKEAGLLLSNVLVPASNPYNPFGVPVRVTARLGSENGTEGIERRTDFTRLLLGVRGEFASRWDYEASVSTTRDTGDRQLLNGTVNATARTAALAASTTSAALNPFTSGLAASDDVLRGIWTDTARQNDGRKDQVTAFVRGPVMQLPAGSVDAIAGVEWARDRYKAVVPGTVATNSRSSEAAYGELRVPLMRSGEGGKETWNLAALTVAARNDHYTEFGAASTYQGGLELRPARSLLLRASAASSFKPPTLLQTAVDDLSLQLGTLNLLDPARGNEPIVSGELLRSTNHDLKPEKGRAFALGALWEPGASGTRLGLTAWRVKIDGLIALLTPQLVLNNESLFGAFVNRAPASGGQPGVVTRLVWAEVNFGRVQTGGVDIEAAHSWQSDTGRFTVGASVTRATQYDVAIAPGAPVDQRLGKRFVDYWAPKWKGRLSAGLDEGRWSLGLTSRYLGAYQDAGTSQRRLGDSWVHDLTGRVNLNRLGMNLGPVKSATVALSIVNLTDRQPQFADASPFFDSSQADWRGRYFSLRFAMDW
jgi:iron complex outermembrane receptor protein